MPRRPSKKWFDKMKRKMEKQYPSYGEKRISKIVAGIWYDYPESTRKRLVRQEKQKGGKKKVGKKKWGKIGAPHSAKRKRYLAKLRKKR